MPCTYKRDKEEWRIVVEVLKLLEGRTRERIDEILSHVKLSLDEISEKQVITADAVTARSVWVEELHVLDE